MPSIIRTNSAPISSRNIPNHMRDIRARGIPQFGAGLVFPVDEKSLMVEPFERPRHWIRIGGLDFGWTHKFVACELWHDRDLDIAYLVKTWAVREQTPLEHAEVLRKWKLRFAWPHDGRNMTLAGAGVPLKDQYAKAVSRCCTNMLSSRMAQSHSKLAFWRCSTGCGAADGRYSRALTRRGLRSCE